MKKEARSKVGKAVASASLTHGKGVYPTGAGSRKNNLVSANSTLGMVKTTLKRFSGRGK
jgi:hypothetical protein